MRFIYNRKEYEVMELHEIGEVCGKGMVALFEVQYCHYEKNLRIMDTKENFINQEKFVSSPIIFEELKFINHFPIDDFDKEYIIDQCQYFIDHEFDKQMDELKYLMKELRKTQYAFELDSDFYLEKLDDKQYDLYDYVYHNIELTDEEKESIRWAYER